MPGFEPPPYPYDRLVPLRAAATAVPGGLIDLSIGTPADPPPAEVAEALGDRAAAQTYPPSVGTPAYREAAAGWLARRFGVGGLRGFRHYVGLEKTADKLRWLLTRHRFTTLENVERTWRETQPH